MMHKKRYNAELLADKLSLPADAVGATKLSMCGRSRLLIENHRGIISYSDTVCEISCGSVKLVIRGDELRLKAMSGRDMLIGGRIIALEFE